MMVLGSIALVVGALDPMEGSVVILLGSAVLVIGAYVHQTFPHELRNWVIVFVLVAVGVVALFTMTALGGIGRSTGRSDWWGLVLLPYAVGWVLGVLGIIREVIQFFRGKHQKAIA
jgi:hypothetical protein